MSRSPIRTCSGCRRRRDRDELIRVARRPDGSVTVSRTAPGRGAYVCREPSCIEAALTTGRLGRNLRADGPLPDGLRERLLEEGKDG